MSFQDIFKSSFLENVTEFSLLDTWHRAGSGPAGGPFYLYDL